MNQQKNIAQRRIPISICPVQQDIHAQPIRYYDLERKVMDSKLGFHQRLFELRSAKGVSAREMSLALGQGAGYINNLENGHNLPSMKQFFAICTYLEITPSSFFLYQGGSKEPLAELDILARGLPNDSLELLVALARKLQQ